MDQTKTAPRIALVIMPAWSVNEPPHGLSVVAALARDAGATFSVHDLNVKFFRHISPEEQRFWRPEEINSWMASPSRRLWEKYTAWLVAELDAILALKPRCIAFSVNIWTRYFSENAARHVKRRSPETIVMFGGVDCFIGEYNKAFLHDGTCDIICQGEAEISFAAFLREFRDSGEWKTRASGFAYFDGAELVDTGRVELPLLDSKMPIPAFEELDLSLYVTRGALPFYFTRGCPFSCRFCSETVNFSSFRCRQPEEAFAEIMAVLPLARTQAEVPTLNFSDSIFNANVKRLEQLTDLILESGVKFVWGSQGHFHPSFSTQLIGKLARAGLTGAFWGFESGSQHVIDLMRKTFKLEDAIRIIRDCSAAGISQALPVLIGYPGETPADLVETLRFMIRFGALPGVQFLQPGEVMVRPNAELFNEYDKYGLTNNTLTGWATADGSNTPATRCVRTFIAHQVHGNTTLCHASLASAHMFEGIDLNDLAVADDLYAVLTEIYRQADAEAAFAQVLNVPIPELAATETWRRWILIDKNDPAVRHDLQETILHALRSLRAKDVPDAGAAGDLHANVLGVAMRQAATGRPWRRKTTLARAVRTSLRLAKASLINAIGAVRRRAGQPEAARKSALKGWVERVGNFGEHYVFSGWAVDPADPHPLKIEILAEGNLIGWGTTQIQRIDVKKTLGAKTNAVGFDILVSRSLIPVGVEVEVVAATDAGRRRSLPINPGDNALKRRADVIRPSGTLVPADASE